MINVVIILVLVIILIPAFKSTIIHLRGEGSCCGGSKEKAIKKVIKGSKIDEIIIHIHGLHCVNCKIRIENHLNALDGIVAKVNLEKEIVKISRYKNVDEKNLIKVIEDLGYTVV